MRLNQFDYFRAIAILIIVAGHSIYNVFEVNTFAEKLLVTLVQGGTALFVFISGFFFHYVFYQTFNYKKFMRKKFLNVFVPYCTMTTVAMIVYCIFFDHLSAYVPRVIGETNGWYALSKLYINHLQYGTITAPYWYIPFIMMMFALSPFFVRYIKLEMILRIGINFVFLLISMVIFRPNSAEAPIHSVLYYTSVYLLGINYSIHQDRCELFLKGKAWMFALIVILLAIIQVEYLDVVGTYEKSNMLSYQGINIMIIQKIALCLLLLSVLQGYKNVENKQLKLIAAASFSIYFLHEFVKEFLLEIGFISAMQNTNKAIVWMMLVFLVVLISFALAYLIKKLCKSKSQLIVGW
jgi:probable poly-beta-1,6-N-acetyl-D-glucosamine export protein